MSPRAIRIFSSLLACAVVARASCGGGRSNALCCVNVAAWSTNSYVWGDVCGYYPPDPSQIIGARCIPEPCNGCPTGSVGTCCSGTWPGPSGQCALGTDCGGSPTATITTRDSPALPDGWTLASACSQDDGSRLLLNDVISDLADNTPNTCIAHCAAAGYGFAGVEYGEECHCGTGFVSGALDAAAIDPAECDVPCTGDASETCGGSWTIQLYQGPSPTETYPPGWQLVDACATDTPSRVLVGDQMTVLSDNTPATCMTQCGAEGYNWAGVEHGNECHCGTGYDSVNSAPVTDCPYSCPGNVGLTCGGDWRIQLYASGYAPQ